MAERATSSSMIVSEVLRKDNHECWSIVVKNYLQSRNLWDVISGQIDEKSKNWARLNAEALHAIQLSCGSDALSKIREIRRARVAWSRLNTLFRSGGIPDPAQDAHNNRLHRHVVRGEWDAANYLITEDSEAVYCTNYSGKTALHLAVIAGERKIVKELVGTRDERLLRMQDKEGHTALNLVAQLNENTEMAVWMVNICKALLNIPSNDDDHIPLLSAAYAGHKEMTRYLYSETPTDAWTECNSHRGSLLLAFCIMAEIFDVALKVLQSQPPIPIGDQRFDLFYSPLTALASMPSVFPSGFKFKWWHWKRIIYEILIPRYHDPNDWIRIKIISKTKHSDGQATNASEDGFWQNVARCLGLELFGRRLRGIHVLIQDNLLQRLPISVIEELYEEKLTHCLVLQILGCLRERVYSLNEPQLHEASAYDAMLQAAKYGITEFIESMSEANPNLLGVTDENKRGVLSYAILNRQENVFELLLKENLKGRTKWLTSRPDINRNNMLHLVADLGSSSDLDRRSDAALQMQSEIEWFKRVERITHPKCKEERNADGKKPHEVFTESHEKLVKEGAKSAKDTATSFTVVCTLIITVMFAAAFTVPGGNHQVTGYPIFNKLTLFEVFVLADAISLVASSSSVLISIGILTLRYAEQDFRMTVPLMLLVDLFFLFLSVLSMMTAFCAGIAMMQRGHRSVIIAAISLAVVPICAFVMTQVRFFAEIYTSTIGLNVFTFIYKFFNHALISIFLVPYIMLIYITKKLWDF